MNTGWLLALDGPAPSWSSADPDGSVGVDFLGTRAANLEMLTHLTGVYNNAVVSARQHAILAWTAWRFRQNWEGTTTPPTTADWRSLLEAVETIQLVGQMSIGPSLGGSDGGLGSNSAANLPSSGPVPLRFEAYKRNRENTSALAAVQYGPSARPGGLDFLSGEQDIVAARSPRGLALATALDSMLRRSRAYTFLCQRNFPPTIPREDAIDLALNGLVIPGPEHPDRPERPAYVDALFSLDGVATQADRRSETAALLLELVRDLDAGWGVTDQLVREFLLAGQTEGVDAPRLSERLVDTAKRWQVFQLRQIQRYALEAWLMHAERWMSRGFHGVREMLEELERHARSEPAFSCLGPLFDLPAGEGIAGMRRAMGLTTLASWTSDRDIGPWALIFGHLNGASDRDAPGANLALSLGTLWAIEQLVPTEGALRRFAETGGHLRISLCSFATWWRRRANWTLRDVLAEMLEELVLQQHVGIAVARFDNQTRRLRFCQGERGWELLGEDRLSVPILTQDRIATLLLLLADLRLVERVSAEGSKVAWRQRPEGTDVLKRFLQARA